MRVEFERAHVAEAEAITPIRDASEGREVTVVLPSDGGRIAFHPLERRRDGGRAGQADLPVCREASKSLRSAALRSFEREIRT